LVLSITFPSCVGFAIKGASLLTELLLIACTIPNLGVHEVSFILLLAFYT
jgi:hypothetical protein